MKTIKEEVAYRLDLAKSVNETYARMDKNKGLYGRIDQENDMDDAGKRETYFAEISNQEAEERWQDEH